MTKGGGRLSKVNDLKLMNEQKIRECFYNGQVWTKNALSEVTGLSLASSTNILQELLKKEEIIYIGEDDSTGGRKSKKYHINKDYYHILKVVLRRTTDYFEFRLRTVDLLNQVIYEKEERTQTGSVKELIELINDIIEIDSMISIICISIPGICHDGVIDVCDFKCFENLNLKQMLTKQFHKNVVLENDVNIASIGFYHRYEDYKHLVFVYQPAVEYVGCGIIIDGKLYNGFTHFAGELRYLPFYTHSEQDEMLKTNPLELLEKQVGTLCCTINPEVIGIYSDVLDDLNDLKLSNIPDIHKPHIIFVKDFYKMIEAGIYQISIKNILEREGRGK